MGYKIVKFGKRVNVFCHELKVWVLEFQLAPKGGSKNMKQVFLIVYSGLITSTIYKYVGIYKIQGVKVGHLICLSFYFGV